MTRLSTIQHRVGVSSIAALAVFALGSSSAIGQSFNAQVERAGHILRRTQFGVGPYDLGGLITSGTVPQTTAITTYFNAQMASNPQTVVDNPEFTGIVDAYGTAVGAPGIPALGASQVFPLPPQAATWTVEELTEREIGMALWSNYQLREVMTQFWRRHFNTNYDAVRGYFLAAGLSGADASSRAAYFEWLQMDQFRSHALGRFEDLLMASAQGASMLIYLDGVVNGTPSGGMQIENQNYARELLELHTLGESQRVDLSAIGLGVIDAPNYHTEDIKQVARAFSGWSLAQTGVGSAATFAFTFNPGNHIAGGNTVVGGIPSRDMFYTVPSVSGNPNGQAINPFVGGLTLPIAAGNTSEGIALLQFLANNPVTKDHICRKLYRYFISEVEPPIGDPVIAAGVNAWGSNGGNICAVLLAMLDGENRFRDDIGIRWQLARTPLQAMGQTVRYMNGRVVDPGFASITRARLAGIRQHLEGNAGQRLLRYPSPEGYPTVVRDQFTTSQYLSRVRFNQEIYSAYTFGAPHPFYSNVDVVYDFLTLASLLGTALIDLALESSVEAYTRAVASTFGELPIDIVSSISFLNSASTDQANGPPASNLAGLIATGGWGEYADRLNSYKTFVLSWSHNTLQK